VLGLTLWFVWFGATYGGVAVACAVAPPPAALGPLNWLNASVLLLAAATTAAFVVGAWASARTARRLPPGCAAHAALHRPRVRGAVRYRRVSTAAVALPALLLAPCT
jgi:hypothetical protein